MPIREGYLCTETADFARASRLALSWFKRLGTEGAASHHAPKTVHDAARAFLADLSKPVTKEFHRKIWSVIAPFFKSIDVDAVDTPTIKEFIRWRRQHAKVPLSASTIHKNLTTLRRIMRFAVEEGWLDRMPVFPKGERIVSNPRPWLDPDEWQTLRRAAKERCEEPDLNPRTKLQRQELYDFILLQVHSCARVDELRNLRVRDCTVRQHPEKDRPYLEMRITGKTGTRKSIAWSGAATAYTRLVERGHLKPEDFLFREHHKDGFRELLYATRLRTDALGKTRNLKSLRSTGLMLRIKSNPRLNLKLLAENAGTSVMVLDKFYLARLTVDMGVEELL